MCMCNFDLQPLTFTFEGEAGKVLSISLGADDLFTRIGVDSDGPVCRINFLRAPPCLQGPGAAWILGNAFLRSVYIVHDYRDLKVTIFKLPDSPVFRPSEPMM